jgi:hypothetical protein
MPDHQAGSLKNRKALSKIIAPIILVAVTVTVALGVYWVNDVSTHYMSFEQIMIEAGYSVLVPGKIGGWEITISLKNTGTDSATIMNLVINETPIILTNPIPTGFADENPGTILCNIPVDGLEISPGETKSINIWIDDDFASLSSNTIINVVFRSRSGMDYYKFIRLA